MRHRFQGVQLFEVELQLDHQAVGSGDDQVEQRVAQPVDVRGGAEPVLCSQDLWDVLAALEEDVEAFGEALDSYGRGEGEGREGVNS